MCLGDFSCPHDVFHRRLVISVSDVVANACRKKKSILKDDPDVPAQALQREVPHVAAVNSHFAFCHIVTAHDQLDDSRFARSRRPQQSDDGTRLCLEVNVVQSRDVSPVMKRYTLELDTAFHLRKILGIRFLSNVLGCIQYFHQPFPCRFCLRQIVDLKT